MYVSLTKLAAKPQVGNVLCQPKRWSPTSSKFEYLPEFQEADLTLGNIARDGSSTFGGVTLVLVVAAVQTEREGTASNFALVHPVAQATL